MTVGEWLKAKDFRNNRLWKLGEDGIMRTQIGKEWISAREFDKRFPSKQPITFYLNPENPDKTKIFMY